VCVCVCVCVCVREREREREREKHTPLESQKSDQLLTIYCIKLQSYYMHDITYYMHYELMMNVQSWMPFKLFFFLAWRHWMHKHCIINSVHVIW
jgi:hypothetical protein